MNYDTATTPYLYKGHSDTTSQYPDVALPYIGYQKLLKKIAPQRDEWRFNNFNDEWDWDKYDNDFSVLDDDQNYFGGFYD